MVILLVDMDAFFASVEQAMHPHLAGKPVIVCGDPGRRGVVTAASYEARPFGVRAGMPLVEARQKCPQAEYVEGNPEKYVSTSLELLRLYLKYTPDVEPFSVDEAFVGLGNKETLETGEVIAAQIQREIDETFHLGASIGVGPNKLIAKMAAGVSKPRGITVLDPSGYCHVFWEQEVQQLWGVGPQLATRMRSLGISTVGELAHAPEAVLKQAFGIIGPQLKEAAWGRDETPLIPYHQGVEAKSMGHEVTLPADSADPAFLRGILLRLSDQVARRARGEGYVGRVVVLKLRKHNFQTCIRQRALSSHTDDHGRIFRIVETLLAENWSGEPLRLVGVTLAALAKHERSDAPELFREDERQHQLRAALDRVRDRLGEASVVPAGSLTHRRSLRHVPFGTMSCRPRSTAS